MALLPLAKFVEGTVIVDSKSGTSGAGRAAKVEQLFAEVSSNVRAYNIGTHRHQGEIGERLSSAVGARVPVLFSPHLLPIARGLLSTCYVNLGSGADVGALMQDAYGDEPFVSLKGEGVFPEPKNVRGTNRVEIGWHTGSKTGVSVIVTAIDNLGKGAAGQAVQNFNLMCGFEETSGLDLIPALP